MQWSNNPRKARRLLVPLWENLQARRSHVCPGLTLGRSGQWQALQGLSPAPDPFPKHAYAEVRAAQSYFTQERISCSEAPASELKDIALFRWSQLLCSPWPGRAWCRDIRSISHQLSSIIVIFIHLVEQVEAMMAVDQAISGLRFAHVIFTRWPIWELLGKLVVPGLEQQLRARIERAKVEATHVSPPRAVSAACSACLSYLLASARRL